MFTALGVHLGQLQPRPGRQRHVASRRQNRRVLRPHRPLGRLHRDAAQRHVGRRQRRHRLIGKRRPPLVHELVQGRLLQLLPRGGHLALGHHPQAPGRLVQHPPMRRTARRRLGQPRGFVDEVVRRLAEPGQLLADRPVGGIQLLGLHAGLLRDGPRGGQSQRQLLATALPRAPQGVGRLRPVGERLGDRLELGSRLGQLARLLHRRRQLQLQQRHPVAAVRVVLQGPFVLAAALVHQVHRVGGLVLGPPAGWPAGSAPAEPPGCSSTDRIGTGSAR